MLEGKTCSLRRAFTNFQDHFWEINWRQTRPDRLPQDEQALWFLQPFEALQVGDVFPVLLLDLQGSVGRQMGDDSLIGFL